MPQQPLNNGDTFGAQRTKINANDAENAATAAAAVAAAAAAASAATAAQTAAATAIQSAIPFSATTSLATYPGGTFTPTSGTAPPGGYGTLTCTSNPGALLAAVDGITALGLNDSLLWSGALGVWTLQKAKLATADLSDAANIERIVGTFATSTALQASAPAASNAGAKGLVGSAAPYATYVSDGQSWLKTVSSSTDLSDVARRAGGTSIVLDGQVDYAPLNVTGVTAISISGSTRAAQASMVVVADGTNAPTITGANEWGTSFGYLNTANVPNRLDAWYDGVACRYAWSQEAVPSVVDTTAPTVSTYAVNGSTLTLTYSETLKTTAPAATAFSVVGAGGITQTPSTISISGAVVSLGLGTPATNANTVTVAYTAPGTNPIQDPAGNVAASFTAHAVTNSTPVPDTVAPVLSSSQVNGATLTLTYGETLKTTAPAASSYSVIGAGGTTQAPTAVSIAGAVVSLTLATPAVNGNTVTLNYTPPGSNAIQDAAGNQSVALTGQAVTNNTASADTTAPVLTGASVNGATLTLTYGEALASPGPAASAYSVAGAGGVTQTPSAVAISGSTVVLTLGTPAVSANTVTLSYTVPGSNPVRDAAGNASVALTASAVTNATSSGFETETNAWLTRVTSAGGNVSSGTQTAVNAFVAGCKTDGTFALFRRLNLVVGDYAASQVPLVNTSGSSVETMTSMTSADYAEATGWTTDGTTKVVKTGYTPSEATGGVFAYLRTAQASDTNGRVPIGCQVSGGSLNAYRLAGNRDALGASSAGAVSGIWGGQSTAAGVQASTTGGLVAGMWHDTRTSATVNTLLFNGASVATSATSVTPVTPSADIWVMALNNAGAFASGLTSGSRLAAYGVDSGMTTTQAAALYSRMQTFQTAMARQV